MLLADAIEAWGQAHKAELDQSQKLRLGGIWSTVRKSEAGMFDIETMGKDDARGVMALFENDDRREVSQTLNRVRKWAIAQQTGRAAPAPVAPAQTERLTSDPTSGQVPATGQPSSGTGFAPSRVPTGPSEATDPPIHSIDPLPPHSAPSSSMRQGPVPQLDLPHTGGANDSEGPRLLVIAAIIAVVLIGAYFAFFRGDDDGDAPTGVAATGQLGDDQANGTTGSTEFAGVGSGDFCNTARELDENDPLDSFGFGGEEYFRGIDDLFGRVVAVAPPEIAADIATIRSTFSQMGSVAAQYGYNTADPAFATALAALDTTAMDTATANLDLYLRQVCNISTDDPASTAPAPDLQSGLGNLSDADAEAIGSSVLAGLGVSPELAECLNRELGDITTAAADPAVLNLPVCGTTLLEVLQGIG